MPNKFVKKYGILYTVCRGKWDKFNINYHTMERDQQEANQVMLHKGNKE